MSGVSTRSFCFPAGSEGLAEYHITLQGQDGTLSFEEQLIALLKAYTQVTEGKTVLLRRFFLSDPANQAARLESELRRLPAAATSLIGQPPLNGTKLAAWVFRKVLDLEGGQDDAHKSDYWGTIEEDTLGF